MRLGGERGYVNRHVMFYDIAVSVFTAVPDPVFTFIRRFYSGLAIAVMGVWDLKRSASLRW